MTSTKDGVCQAQDNCDGIANSDQTDSDGDGTGDACECSDQTRQDRDADGVEDCIDACLLPTSTFGPFVPNLAAANCGCQPVALVGQGQLRRWEGVPGNLGFPHLDALRCNFSADSAPTDGPFLLRDVTRQGANERLPGHLHFGALGSGLLSGILSQSSAVLSQEMITKINTSAVLGNAEIVQAGTMAGFSQPPTQTNRAAIDAQVGAQLFYDFLRTITGAGGRQLISISDPAPGPLASMVSSVNEPMIPGAPAIAYFFPDLANPFVAYPSLQPFGISRFGSAALDVIGHEWFHGFTSLTTQRLRPVGMGLCTFSPCSTKAAQVEEAFADAVGVSFEIALATGGRIPGKTTADFRFAEDLAASQTRDLANPPSTARPDHTRRAFFQSNCRPDSATSIDDTGLTVPTECTGPFQKAFTLLASGGSFPSVAQQTAGGYTAPTVNVAAVGVPTATRIIFHANQTEWDSDQNYGHYVNGMVMAAERLFGVGSAQARSTANAFDAVGLIPGRVTIGFTITPAGAGSVRPLPTVIVEGAPVTIEAVPVNTSRTFREFIVRVNGVAAPPISQNPASILALPGTTVEVRFN